MAEIIAILILTFSFSGMAFIVWRNLPKTSFDFQEESYLSIWKKRLKFINPFKNFSFEIFLQKIIFSIRILSLKIDNLTFNWLKKLRQKYQERKKKEKDNYWEEIKKAKEK